MILKSWLPPVFWSEAVGKAAFAHSLSVQPSSYLEVQFQTVMVKNREIVSVLF